MEFLDLIGNFFATIYDTFKLTINFVTSLPTLYSSFFEFLPEPFKSIIIVFLPILIIFITWRFFVG